MILSLLRQHRFYAAVCILGTAVTIAFVMVVVMVYDFRTADVAPETGRSRTLYHDGTQCSRRNGTNFMGYRGLGAPAFEAVYTDLPGVEAVTWSGPLASGVCALPASSDRHPMMVRPVAANWFDCFSYRFLSGRPFTQAEYDTGRAAFEDSDSEFRNYQSRQDEAVRRFVVISRRLAGLLFGGADEAVGQTFLLDFQTVQVVGVVEDVSSIFQTAYADVWEPFTLLNETRQYHSRETDGRSGLRNAVLRLEDDASPAAVRQEIGRRIDLLNSQGTEYVLSDPRVYTHTEYTFFRGSSIDARLVYVLLLVVLLVVPAVGISGLVHAQMQSRLSEIAIRKAYGATNAGVVCQLFRETLWTTLAGGVLGYGLSCLLVVLGSRWLFGTGGVELAGIAVGGSLLLRPVLFVSVLAACLMFNVLSALLPAVLAVRKSIGAAAAGR